MPKLGNAQPIQVAPPANKRAVNKTSLNKPSQHRKIGKAFHPPPALAGHPPPPRAAGMPNTAQAQMLHDPPPTATLRPAPRREHAAPPTHPRRPQRHGVPTPTAAPPRCGADKSGSPLRQTGRTARRPKEPNFTEQKPTLPPRHGIPPKRGDRLSPPHHKAAHAVGAASVGHHPPRPDAPRSASQPGRGQPCRIINRSMDKAPPRAPTPRRQGPANRPLPARTRQRATLNRASRHRPAIPLPVRRGLPRRTQPPRPQATDRNTEKAPLHPASSRMTIRARPSTARQPLAACCSSCTALG